MKFRPQVVADQALDTSPVENLASLRLCPRSAGFNGSVVARRRETAVNEESVTS